jgi:hypothetical protein
VGLLAVSFPGNESIVVVNTTYSSSLTLLPSQPDNLERFQPMRFAAASSQWPDLSGFKYICCRLRPAMGLSELRLVLLTQAYDFHCAATLIHSCDLVVLRASTFVPLSFHTTHSPALQFREEVRGESDVTA